MDLIKATVLGVILLAIAFGLTIIIPILSVIMIPIVVIGILYLGFKIIDYEDSDGDST